MVSDPKTVFSLSLLYNSMVSHPSEYLDSLGVMADLTSWSSNGYLVAYTVSAISQLNKQILLTWKIDVRHMVVAGR